MSTFIKVATRQEMSGQGCKCVEVEGRRIALFNLDGEFHAIDDTCTHSGGPLSEGTVEDGEVECPWHGGRFKITSGEATCPPAYENVRHYNLRVMGEDIEVEVEGR